MRSASGSSDRNASALSLPVYGSLAVIRAPPLGARNGIALQCPCNDRRVALGVGFEQRRSARMTDRRRSPAPETGRRIAVPQAANLAQTADASRGASNLAAVPRAGNLSTDTRAG